MDSIGQDPQQNYRCRQAHPDSRSKEACTVTCVGKLVVFNVEALNLRMKKGRQMSAMKCGA